MFRIKNLINDGTNLIEFRRNKFEQFEGFYTADKDTAIQNIWWGFTNLKLYT